ncbi:hypothetical protein [Corticicoccus populi]|uniref:Uncharacterized protein n=1 Tax=Corticicoccus populi TaxID=1812821 RepID=A0ABW5WS22_9STAP
MTVIVKYSDSTTKKTDLQVVNDSKETKLLKKKYINDMLNEKDTFLELIYPHHSETYTLYSINYRRCRK